MLYQFGESDVHLTSPAVIALVHNASYLEVPLYFCYRTLFLHPFRVDFIHTRIDIFCLLALSFWKPNSKGDSMATAVTFVHCTDTSTRPSFPRNHSWMPDKAKVAEKDKVSTSGCLFPNRISNVAPRAASVWDFVF
jgi:hypothetical protein